MQSLLLFVGCLLPFAFAQIDTTDLNCTVKAPAGATNPDVYSSTADSCSNTYSDAACQATYADTAAVAATPTSPGTDKPRQKKCWAGADGKTFSQDIKDIVIATCPKFCGFCCQTPEYTCDNVRMPRINCNTVTTAMCKSTEWRSVIAQDCPNKCGFCLLGGCIDSAVDCASQPSICLTKGLESFVASNCQRTCGLCTSATSTGSSIGGTCVDSSVSCVNWVRNGFCTSTFYTQTVKRQQCGRSCGLC